MTLSFGVLGPVEAWRDGAAPVPLERPRHRALLGLLVLNAGQVMSSEHIAEAMWGSCPPATARAQIQASVSALRRSLGPAPLLTRPAGYQLAAGPDDVDVRRFDAAVAAARREPDPAARARALVAALALWRGAAFEGVRADYAEGVRLSLDERRLAAVEERYAAELDAGRHGEAVAGLLALVHAHPLRDGLRGQLMLALYRAGRQAEALGVYRDGRALLADGYGLDPSPALAGLAGAILRADAALAAPARPAPVAALGTAAPPDALGTAAPPDAPGTAAPPAAPGTAAPPAAPAPGPAGAALPPDPVHLVGRAHLLAALLSAVPPAGTPGRAVVVAGPGGVGKTAVALRLAHRLRDRFPDGQLFLDLRGMDAPLACGDAQRRLLAALGAGAALPADGAELTARYREVTARRRLLVVLDNAADEAQVRPLLPAGPHCLALVTARRPLAALDGAPVVAVPVLDDDDAARLLELLAGAGRRRGRPAAAAQVARACGGLPLAIRLAAGKLAARPRWSLDDLALRLAEERGRLDVLAAGDLAVRASIELSHRSLGEPARRALPLLAAVDAAELPHWLARRLTGLPDPGAQRVLDELVEAQLVDSTGFGPGRHERYRLHDLVRLFAAERLADESPATVAAAVRRAADGMAALAGAVHAALYADNARPGGPRAARLCPAAGPDAHPDPAGELAAEYPTALTLVRLAAGAGDVERAGGLALVLAAWQERQGRVADWLATHELVGAGGAAEPALVTSLAHAHLAAGRCDEAVAGFRRAARLAERLGDEAAAACALAGAGAALRYRGDAGDEAGELLETAVRRATAAGDTGTVCDALRALAMAAREGGDPHGALLRYRRCLELGDFGPVWRAQLRHDVALCHLNLGDLALAEAELRDALAALRAAGDRPWQAAVLRSLAYALRLGGRHDEALATLADCRDAFEELGDRRWVGYVLRDLGEVERLRGDPRAALRHLAAAERALRQAGDERGLTVVAASRRAAESSLGEDVEGAAAAPAGT